MTPTTRLRLLGVLVFVVPLVVTIVGWIKPDPFHDSATVWARFDSAPGFARFDRDVRVRGVNVGTVGTVKRVGDDALVELKLDKARAGTIHADAHAEIRPHTLFEGNSFVDLDPGSDSAQRIGDAGIPLAQTKVFQSLSDVLTVARPPTLRSLKTDLGGLQLALQGRPARATHRALRRLEPFSVAVGSAARAANGPHAKELGGAIRGLSRTVAGLAATRSDLAPGLRASAATLAALNTDAGAPLGAALQGLPGALAATEAGGRRLTVVVDRLRPLATDLRAPLRALPPTLARLRPVLRRATPVLRRALPLVGDLRATLRAAPSASLATRRALDALLPSVSLLQDSLLGALEKPTVLGLPTYQQLGVFGVAANGALAGYQTKAQGSTAPQMGFGHFFRFQASAFTGLASPAPPCSSFSGALRQQLERLSLCRAT